MYESCVDFCQQKATQSRNNSIEFTNVLSSSDFNDRELSDDYDGSDNVGNSYHDDDVDNIDNSNIVVENIIMI